VFLPVYSACQRPVAAAVIVTVITISNVPMSVVSIVKAELLHEDVLRFGSLSHDTTRGVGPHEAMKLCEIVGLLGTQMLKEAYYYP
jgi:hypothetical protein